MANHIPIKPTVIDNLNELIEKVAAKRTNSNNGEAARNYSIAITALEDARMRYTSGVAHDGGFYKTADLEK